MHKPYESCLNCICLRAHHFMKDMEVSVVCCNLRTTGVLPHCTCCKEWDSQSRSHLALSPWHEFSRALLIPINLGHFSIYTSFKWPCVNFFECQQCCHVSSLVLKPSHKALPWICLGSDTKWANTKHVEETYPCHQGRAAWLQQNI